LYESSPPTSVTARSHTARRHPGVGPNSGSRSGTTYFCCSISCFYSVSPYVDDTSWCVVCL
jgi:hypothetical protein